MAEEINVKLLIEAEDKSRAAYDAAKQHTKDLIEQQKELIKLLDQERQASERGDKAKMMSAKDYFDTRRKAFTEIPDQITKAHNLELWTLNALNTAHTASAKAVEDANAKKAKSIHGVTGALTHYLRHFVSLAAAEEVVRRSIDEYAKWERGMARIEIQTGKSTGGVEHLAHSIDQLARMTGASVADLQKNFLTFHAGIGEMNHDVVHMFEEVVSTAYSAGVSVDVMARTAIAAVKTMDVPFSEVKNVLATVVREIPASAMGAWDNAQGKILSVMRSIGSTGASSVEQAAKSFGLLTQALGNGQDAANALNRMLARSTDQNTMFGKVMTQQMIANRGQADEELKYHEAFRRELERHGMLDTQDPQRAMAMRQAQGVTEEEINANQKFLELWAKIRAEAERSGKPIDEVRASIMRLNRGPQQVLDELKASFGELFTALGKFLGPTLPDTISAWFTGMAVDVERVNLALEKFRELIGARLPEDKAAGTPAKETPLRFDPVGWIYGAITGQSVEQQIEHARTAPGLSPGKPGFGIEDEIFRWLFGDKDPAAVRRELRRNIRPSAGGPGTPQLGGRAVPAGPRPPGYATGGEFRVGGQGGVDSQPVEFMATPGEHVAITSPLAESLQQQQDKADQAMREHFARFRVRTAARGGADWWPGSQARAPGPGAGGATPGGASREGTGGGPSGGGRGGGGGGDTTTTPDPNAAYNALPAYARAAPGEAAAGLHRGRVAQRERPAPAGQPATAVQPGQVLPPGGAVFDSRGSGGVNATLVAAVKAGAEFLPPGYRVVITSGHRHGGRPQSNHRRGLALDIQIIRPDGTRIKNYGERRLDPRDADPSGLYGQISRVAYGYLLRNHPDQASKFAWGASFPIPQGGAWHQHPDTMHYSLNNEHGRWSQYRPSNMGPLYPGEPVPGQPAAGSRPVPAGGTTGGPAGGPPVATGPGVVGGASFYDPLTPGGYRSGGRQTASGQPYDPNEWAAAIQLGLRNQYGGVKYGRNYVPRYAMVTHPDGRQVIVKINDVGPLTPGRVIDFNRRVMQHFDPTLRQGVIAGVRVQPLPPGEYTPGPVTPGTRTATTATPTAPATRPRLLSRPDEGPAVPPPPSARAARRAREIAQPFPHVLPQTQALFEARQRGRDRHIAHADALARTRPARTPAGPTAIERAAEAEAEAAEARAAGGPVRAGRSYMVGEDGPELFRPNTPGNVHAAWKGMQQNPNEYWDDTRPAPGEVEGHIRRHGERNQPRYHAGEAETGIPPGVDEEYLENKRRFEELLPGRQLEVNFSNSLMQYRQLADEMQKPLRPNIEFPRSGPIRHRMSRRVEAQRERDVGRMTRYASNSDIGMS